VRKVFGKEILYVFSCDILRTANYPVDRTYCFPSRAFSNRPVSCHDISWICRTCYLFRDCVVSWSIERPPSSQAGVIDLSSVERRPFGLRLTSANSRASSSSCCEKMLQDGTIVSIVGWKNPPFGALIYLYLSWIPLRNFSAVSRMRSARHSYF